MHLLLTTARRLALPILRHLAQLGTLSRSRRDLRRLDDRLLRDIGLTRDEAEAEAARPDWDIPPHWRREKVDSFARPSALSRLK